MLYVKEVGSAFASGRFYDSSNYHLSPDKLSSDYSPIRFEREIRQFRQFCQAGAVLDVGCSTGAFLCQLQSRYPAVYTVTGTDVAEAPLDCAAAKGIQVVRGTFTDHDFGAQRFDAVTFWAVMEHLLEPLKFLEKAAEVLRAGGHCFVLVPNMRSLAVRLLGSRYRYIMPEHLNCFTRRTLKKFVQRERRFRMRALRATHFNPAVIWQDFRNSGRFAAEPERARLLKKTTSLKQNPRLWPAQLLYHACEQFLARFYLADNLVIVLQRLAGGDAV